LQVHMIYIRYFLPKRVIKIDHTRKERFCFWSI